MKPERCVFGFCDTLLDQFVHKANSNDGKHKTAPMSLVYDLTEKESFFAAQYTFDKNKFEFDMDFDPLDSSLKSLICRIPDSGYAAGKEYNRHFARLQYRRLLPVLLRGFLSVRKLRFPHHKSGGNWQVLRWNR